jgi:hypothetical protein
MVNNGLRDMMKEAVASESGIETSDWSTDENGKPDSR